MTTQRLYIEDSYQTEFSAQVVRKLKIDGEPAVVLDRTCFYPESGGQPWDTGSLNGIPVKRVVEKEGEPVHVLERETDSKTVKGRIHWERRFDHMQQHAGQHVLSQAFFQILKGETLSFHLGEDDSTVEIGIRSIPEEQLREIEDLANRIVWENRSILSKLVPEEEAEQIPLRKPPAKSGTLRIIEMEKFDYSACGGTHPRSTGEIGLIKVTGWERIRDNLRFTFLCGKRSLRDYRMKNDVLLETARMLSSSPEDVPDLLEKNNTEMKELKKENKNLRSELSRMEAEELIRTEKNGVIRRIFPDKSPEEARFLALNIIREPGFCIIAGLPLPERIHIILARSEDVNVDMREVMAVISSRIEVKGGGRPSLVEMSGKKIPELEDVLAEAAEYAERKISEKS